MQKNKGRGNQKGRLREIICPQCKLPYLRSIGRINWAAKIKQPMFCGISCYAAFRATGESLEARERRFAAVVKRKYEHYWALKNSRRPFVAPFPDEVYIKLIDKIIRKFGLTEQQAEVISHVLRGRHHEAAASDMGITKGTFRTHLGMAYMKIGAWNVVQCVILLTPMLVKIHEEDSAGSSTRVASAAHRDTPLLPFGGRA